MGRFCEAEQKPKGHPWKHLLRYSEMIFRDEGGSVGHVQRQGQK